MDENTYKIAVLVCLGITTTAAVASTVSVIRTNSRVSKAAESVGSLSAMAEKATGWANETVAAARMQAA